MFRIILPLLFMTFAAAIAKAEEAGGGDALWRSIFARDAAAQPLPPNAPLEPQAALGRSLFHDPRLSGAEQRSCASCHQPERGFTDGLPKGAAIDGTPLARNTPHIFNVRWGKSFYWDGRAPTLEAQARFPILASNELGGNFETVVSRLAADPTMRDQFGAAFPSEPEISEKGVLAALAAYERTIVAPLTRFDAWVAGNDNALAESEKAGFQIFVGKGGCVSCHGGWRFTDDNFHDIGLRSFDPGRGAIDPSAGGLPMFKTPSLRQLALTAPYMHDGSLSTLESVVQHYAGGLEVRPSLSPNIVRDLELTAEERAQLVAFLGTLTE